MRPSACTDAASGTSSNAAQAGGGNSSSPPAAVIRRRSRLLATVLDVARKGCPFPTAVDALSTLIFVRGMLAAQPLHALSHQLAAAAAALEPCGDGAGGGPGGADVDAAAIEQGRAALGCFLENTCTFYKVFLGDADIADLEYPSPVMVGAVAAERDAGVEDLARGLAESCVLEHAARVLLLLQARGPHASQRREEWWRLAAGALAYGGEFLQGEEYGTDPDVVAWELCRLVTEPLLQLWPNGRRDLDALPAEPPTEVAAALAGGLPQAVMALMGSSGTGALSVGSQRVACELLKACCNSLFLTPLLVYGGSESVAAFLGMLGSARRDRHGQARAPPPAPQQCPALRVEAAEAAEPMQPPAAAAGVVGPWGMRCGAATGRSWRGRR
ncbi:hypothetical protein HYH03_009478 [Edaphochlamys debaryana]|uniref:Uncharacterized protein n=1 Tax=Edaphochlamys debaryana TaxID=47281 RepID=A0A836BYH3_9CHLO|nr:hypothetical protein HYH03_009478 [Edaphochlamys debaryana]|eukprot:KAG2492234.1 hypothetical protein HYH03_009478 [Edaphochlamys debaryana]